MGMAAFSIVKAAGPVSDASFSDIAALDSTQAVEFSLGAEEEIITEEALLDAIEEYGTTSGSEIAS